MMKKTVQWLTATLTVATLSFMMFSVGGCTAHAHSSSNASLLGDSSKVSFVTRSRTGGLPGEKSCVANHIPVEMDLKETAIIVVDMWKTHWCKRMTQAGLDMAPQINAFITEARKRGALIIHCPSGGTGHYKELPAIKNLAEIPNTPAPNGYRIRGWNRQMSIEKCVMMIDRTPLAGCGCVPRCRGRVDTHQLEDIKIHDNDLITASGPKLVSILLHKKIKRVFYTGAAIERCVLGRPFGLRHMIGSGFEGYLVRDLTDGMTLYPWMKEMSHTESNQVSLEHVERFVAPTIISAALLDPANQMKISKAAVDNGPSMRLVPMEELKGVDGFQSVKRYSKVESNVYEVIALRKSIDGQPIKMTESINVGAKGKLVVTKVELAVNNTPVKAQWAQKGATLEIKPDMPKGGTNLLIRVQLKATGK